MANQIIKFLRALKRAEEILYRHGGSSIDIIPVIYFREGIIPGSLIEMKRLHLPRSY
jgi:hypothetical protein